MTGSTAGGAEVALTDDDAAGGDVKDVGVAACGGGAGVHCTKGTPAATIAASPAARRCKRVNGDGSSLLAPTLPRQKSAQRLPNGALRRIDSGQTARYGKSGNFNLSG